MRQRRWLILALVFIGILVSYVDRGNLGIAAESIMRDLRLDPKLMGVLLSAFFWTYAVCQLPAGLLVDRFGIKTVYASAFFIWSLASASIALSRGGADIFASRLVLGFAESIGPIASLAFIRANFSARESGIPVSIYIAGQTFGPACGTLLGAALLANFGWRPMFAATGLGALLWVPLWLLSVPSQKPKTIGIAVKPAATRWPWSALFASPSFWTMPASIFFLSYYWYFVLSWVPAYLTMSRGYSTAGMGRILSIPLFTMAATNVLSGAIADRLSKKSESLLGVRVLFAAGGSLGAASILLLNVLTGHRAVLPILLLSICAFGVASSSYWTIAQQIAPAAMTGRTIGYLNTMSQLGGVAAPLITGWSLGPQKHFGFAILVAGISPLVSCALLFLSRKGLDQLRERFETAGNVKITG